MQVLIVVVYFLNGSLTYILILFYDSSGIGAQTMGLQSWLVRFYFLWNMPIFLNHIQISISGISVTFFNML